MKKLLFILLFLASTAYAKEYDIIILSSNVVVYAIDLEPPQISSVTVGDLIITGKNLRAITLNNTVLTQYAPIETWGNYVIKVEHIVKPVPPVVEKPKLQKTKIDVK